MTQDTRKDRRVKIVSLNVRYKSATVDEFIENHALDVSRGGIYIKTSNPFPQGTLLKFEIRLASDQAVITGVGRVVWKRDPSQGAAEHPAGMGVKFIKVDDPSRVIIDRLTSARPDAGRAFESESEGAASSAPLSLPGAPGARPPVVSRPAAGSQARPTGQGNAPAIKATTGTLPMGVPASPPRATPSSAPRPAPGGMFPKNAISSAPPPRQEQTVMKQAAELLEEALREAGGSMDEVGNNPLFSGPIEATSPAANPDTPEGDPEGATNTPAEVVRSSRPVATPKDEAATARAMVAALAPGPAARSSLPPDVGRAPAGAGGTRTQNPFHSKRPIAEAIEAAPPPDRSSTAIWWALGVLAIIGGAGFAFRRPILGALGVGGEATPEIPSAAPLVGASAIAPAPAAHADASVVESDVKLDAAAETAVAAADASGRADSATKITVSAPLPRTRAAAPPPIPPAPATASALPVAEPTATSTSASVGLMAGTSAQTPAPTTATSGPSAAPTARTKAPAKPIDDNPY